MKLISQGTSKHKRVFRNNWTPGMMEHHGLICKSETLYVDGYISKIS